MTGNWGRVDGFVRCTKLKTTLEAEMLSPSDMSIFWRVGEFGERKSLNLAILVLTRKLVK